MRIVSAVLVLAAACTAGDGVPGRDGEPPDDDASASPTEARHAGISYVVSPDPVPAGRAPVATLRNSGNVTLEYGNPFTLFRQAGGTWDEVETNCVFTLELRFMEPGDSQTQEIGPCDRESGDEELRPGLYRVTKTVHVTGAGGRDGPVTVEDVFRVVGARD